MQDTKSAPAATSQSIDALSAEQPVAQPVATATTDSAWTPSRWAEWVECSGLSGAAINLARNTVLVADQDGRWTLQLSPRHQMLAGGQALPQLQQRLAAQFPQHGVQLVMVEPVDETPAQRRQRELTARREQAERAVRDDPVVKALMTTFEAQLVPDSLQIKH